jgi:hypothetical protein
MWVIYHPPGQGEWTDKNYVNGCVYLKQLVAFTQLIIKNFPYCHAVTKKLIYYTFTSVV